MITVELGDALVRLTREGEKMESGKKVYSSPKLVVYGNVTEITQGLADGAALDATFPIGTPKTALGFS